MHKHGEIVLIPVPFSDLTSYKKRPVESTIEKNGKLSDNILKEAVIIVERLISK